MKKKNKKLMILIVAYNAQTTIKKLLDRFPTEAITRASEIVLADDASKDDTTKVAQEYKKKNKLNKLTVIRHEKNKSYGGNQKWGYGYGIKKGYDIVVMIHGDCQYPPEYILPMVKKMEQDNADFVFGSRMTGNPLGGNMPLYKYLGNKFLTTIENLILGTNLSEFHSGFRAYNLHALKQIPFSINSNNFHFDSEIIIQLIIAKKKISEITIPTFYGEEKSNVKVIQYGLNILKILCQYMLNKLNIKKYEKFNIKYG